MLTPLEAGASELRPAFERLKSLVGTWDVAGSERYVVYYLSGGEETLVEDFRGEPTMASFYHMDGDELMLTHYCNAGNQPRMKAVGYDRERDVLSFRFLDITNLQNPTDYHTRDLRVRFVDDGKVELRFTGLENGESKENVLTLKRRSK